MSNAYEAFLIAYLLRINHLCFLGAADKTCNVSGNGILTIDIRNPQVSRRKSIDKYRWKIWQHETNDACLHHEIDSTLDQHDVKAYFYVSTHGPRTPYPPITRKRQAWLFGWNLLRPWCVCRTNHDYLRMLSLKYVKRFSKKRTPPADTPCN